MGKREPKGVHNVVCVGCSAGGVEAVPKLLSRLPTTTPASIFVVMHVSSESESSLPAIINRQTKIPAAHARDGEQIKPGRIYVAPPDFHIVLNDTMIHLSHGPKENRHRPAVDPLFRSAARHHGPRTIGVILTGGLDDGTAGLGAIKRCGGVTLVQHPDDATVPSMPESALRSVEVDHIASLAKLRSLLPKLIETAPGAGGEPGCHENGSTINLRETMSIGEMEQCYGPASALVCPECSGPIWETNTNGVLQFRCLVGHIFSPESFIAEEGIAAERALWVAVKTLQERASLLRKLAGRAQGFSQSITASNFLLQAEENEQHADVIRNILRRFANPTED